MTFRTSDSAEIASPRSVFSTASNSHTTPITSELNFIAGRRPQVTIPVTELRKLVDEFFLDCQYRQLATATVIGYRNILKHLFWFFEQRNIESCSTLELKQFCHYLLEPPEEGGRYEAPAHPQGIPRR